ncbi:MAG: betaine/proline/choline family ABC transporter ATP-binding protein [Emergencia timonensis]|uniref:Quaternary amine transport ATP-binding protein n=1 Tax=Emergencia timonensis TaxID=1776384 RepID=A0A415E7C9_9FIRM|nr:ABC transporter ATP-binding protein [Emergencia timonensis]MBS6175724.1 ABC transporter ATP-binding protein [Clostridiales bacterium]MCB6476318.1 ABC transporter ATP-binding protein [Emergencia timonensis]RHJ89580.1 ATP-binding cassette domain-containing protein [Emergencia timonensis]WNX87545.1 ABC transporter ATP-binding protein [Emergencia timonensis]BDF09381.1 proline/glycine betaine ABC transporter ATP-binding protein [Emergencia timonensis]
MIQFRGVTKEFKGNVVLSDISMDINDGELTVLIGPSGCGKTTTLKMINRLIPASKGEIFIDEKNIEEMDKVQLRRNMGYVIQQGGLFPHMTIRQNIEIIERLEKKDTEKIVENTKQLMKMVDLDPDQFLDRYPTELSGGQRQRIGVIRALANDPEIILLDEPFSALDPVTRSSLQDELIELQSKVGKTMVFVTHDMDEAIKIADRICIMKGGHILQFDTPEMILKQPADEFVANFVGTNRIWDSPEYIKVEDFMIKNPITCKGDMIRNRCIKRMRDHHIDTLLVVDDEKKLRGIVGRKNLFKASRPLMQAEDIMNEVAYVSHVGDNIVDVLKMVEETEVNNIPVLDEEERLVGLLTNSNLVSTLSKQFLTEDSTEGTVSQ